MYPVCTRINTKQYTHTCAAMAQGIRLRLPSCHPRFEPQAHHLHFKAFEVKFVYCERNENKQKEAGFGPFKKHIDKSTW